MSNHEQRKLHQVNHHLSDRNNYKIIQTDPTLQYNGMVNNLKTFKFTLEKNPICIKNNRYKRNQNCISHLKCVKKMIHGDLSLTQYAVALLRIHGFLQSHSTYCKRNSVNHEG